MAQNNSRSRTSQAPNDNAPQATIVAIIDNGANRKATFIKIGALWEVENGNLTGELIAEPIAWRDSKAPHRVLISFAERK